MKACIIANYSITDDREGTPNCFCKLESAMTVIERQISILNANGIKAENIYVQIGMNGEWNSKEVYDFINSTKVNILHSEDGCLSNDIWSMNFYDDEEEYLFLNGEILLNSVVITRLKEKEEKNILVYRTSDKNCGEKDYVEVRSGKIVQNGESSFHYPWTYFAGILKVTAAVVKEMAKRDSCNLQILDYIQNNDTIEPICAVDYDHIYYEAIYKGESSDLNGGSFSSLKCGVFIIKECRGEGRQKLINEINWLLSLPEDIKGYFSKVIQYDIEGENVYYYIPYYGENNIRENLFKGRFDSESTITFIEKVLDWMFENVYHRKTSDNTAGWILDKHINRVLGRLPACSESSSLFRKIVNAERLIINGKEYKNVRELYSKLLDMEDIIDLLTPDELVLTHGDTHFQNVIEYNNNDKGFILVDPRGEKKGADIYYDIGKWYISCHGKYDLIHTDQYTYDFSIEKGTPVCNYTIINDKMSSEFDRIYEGINRFLPKYDKIQKDSYWRMKSLFAEASHNASNAPFHLGKTKDDARSIIVYLLGVVQINDVFRMFIPDRY